MVQHIKGGLIVMYMIPQEYTNQYLECFNSFLNDIRLPRPEKGTATTWAKFIEASCYYMEDIARRSIVAFLEKMDREFKYSRERIEQYYIKYTRPRTLITMCGEITYNRTVYINKSTGDRYVYVDRKMGLVPYIRYTPDVRAYALAAYSDENSMIKVGKELGELIHCKFSIHAFDSHPISRQTIYTFLKQKPIHFVRNEKRKCETLFVLLDEKFIGCQDRENRIMSKVCLIYEGIEIGKRNKLLNKTYFSSTSKDFKYDLITYISEIYDLSSIKTMYCMGDGGSWIKDAFRELQYPGIKQIRCLDKFHAFRALYDLCPDSTCYSIALHYLSRGDINSFRKAVSHFVIDQQSEDNFRYLINNSDEIFNMIHAPAPCSMEQCISHHIQSQFSSVPKAYSSKNIERYLLMRDNFRNGLNLRELFLLACDKSSSVHPVIYINADDIDLSIFDSPGDMPYYSTANLKGVPLFLPL